MKKKRYNIVNDIILQFRGENFDGFLQSEQFSALNKILSFLDVIISKRIEYNFSHIIFCDMFQA